MHQLQPFFTPMPDFTIKIYKQLLEALKDTGYRFFTFEEYMRRTEDGRQKTEVRAPFTILRHDVDLLPQNSLAFARIQHEMGIRGSYYFRAVPESWDEDIIKEIHNLGHEVGYHYEDVDLVKLEAGSWKSEGREAQEMVGGGKGESLKEKGEKQSWKLEAGSRKEEGLSSKVRDDSKETDNSHETRASSLDPSASSFELQASSFSLLDAAILSFQNNLEKLRQLVPVKTICMHGSPRSKYDNRDLWKKYDYRDFGIIGEPYFDMDFDDVFYLTDTGRRWDGWKVSVRDKVPQQERWIEEGLVFGSTGEIIERVRNLERWKLVARSSKVEESGSKVFPSRVMFTFHPQRWTDRPVPWLKELVAQNVKNMVKGVMVRWRKER